MAKNTYIIDHQWLVAQQLPSANYNQRPNGEISLLVIHNISLPAGEYGTGYIKQLFCNELDCSAHVSFDSLRELQVSAHLLIERGGMVTQFVPFDQRAWHAGISCFEGRENCNDFSIGIELEGVDNSPYTEQQYDSLLKVSKQLMAQYPAITLERIVGHCDIAAGRKTDPGQSFDWNYFRQQLGTL